MTGAGYLDALEASAREPGEGREGAGREEDLEHVRELLRVAEAFTGAGEEGLLEFLEKVTLAAEEAGGEESEAVRLMTLHNAKGLEFDVVFLVGLEDGLLPHSRSVDSPHEIEEERRLFYVGLTRARERVFLSLVRRRNMFGSYRDAVPSRFLYDLPASLVRRTDGALPESIRQGRGSFGGTGSGDRVTVHREPRYEEETPSGTSAQGAASGLRRGEGRVGPGGRGGPEDHRAVPGLRAEEDPRARRGDGVPGVAEARFRNLRNR